MKRVLFEEQRAQYELSAANDARLPRIWATGFWAQQGLNSSNVIPVYTYSANIGVPLFTGGRIKAERAKAEIQIRQLKQQEQEVRNRSRST